jgi:tRNA ligase
MKLSERHADLLGKTLIGVALSKLFGMGHTQSDDVTTKKTAPTFLKNIVELLKKNDVVYADR